MKCAHACLIVAGLIAVPAAAQVAPSNPAECRASLAQVAPFMDRLNSLSIAIDGIATAASQNATPTEEAASVLAAQGAFDEADRLSDAGDDILERVIRHCGTRVIEPVSEIRATIGSLRQIVAIGRLSAQATGRVR
jgi:hypothetical protein